MNQNTECSTFNGVEKDTDDIEDITNLVEYLLPSQSILNEASSFGVHYNRNIFNGWVKQPSPCCAASSVAGAWNAVHGYHRQDLTATHHTDVLFIYKAIVEEKLSKKLGAFERKLGCKVSASFWEEFDECAKNYGKELGGKKGTAITKSICEKILRELSRRQKSKRIKHNTLDDSSPIDTYSEIDLILDLYLSEGETFEDLSLFQEEIVAKENDIDDDDVCHILYDFLS